jgi:hypothetical protein
LGAKVAKNAELTIVLRADLGFIDRIWTECAILA